MSGPSSSPRALYAIDLLRFAAAVMVMAYHYLCCFAILEYPDMTAVMPHDIPVATIPWTIDGWVGVEIFFVISGYVIAMSAQGATAVEFVQRRAERLLPAAWICATATAVGLAVAGMSLGYIGPRWLVSVFFVPSEAQIDGSYWTLGIETSFYGLTALTIAVSRGRSAALHKLAVGIGLFSGFFWLVIPPLVNWNYSALLSRPNQLLLVSHGGFFALGMLLYRCATTGWTWRQTLYALFMVSLCGVALNSICTERAIEFRRPVSPLWPFVLVAVGTLIVASAHRTQGGLARHLNATQVRRIGTMTYPLYLLHNTLGIVCLGQLTRLGVPYYCAVPIVAAGMIAAAWAIVRWLEQPLKRTVRRGFEMVSTRARLRPV